MRNAEELLKTKKRDLVSINPDETIHNAIQKMNVHRVGAIIVMENQEKTLGIWTERDLLKHAVAPDFDIQKAVIKNYMTKNIYYAGATESCYQLMDKFLGLRIRHLLVEKDSKLLGMLSIGDVIREVLQEKFNELKAKNQAMSWEYYEAWNWKPE